jgi:hypothetical protein
MAEGKFTRREVERAFRKFNDLVNDLSQTDQYTWGDRFTHLMEHCEKNPVMRLITEPLRANTNIDALSWYRDFLENHRSNGLPYRLPTDDDDCAALLYQFFRLIEYGGQEAIRLTDFCYFAFGESEYSLMVLRFNRELVSKLTREVSYRLDEVMEDIGEATEVSPEVMNVFHYHGHTMNIHGSVQGSNIAVGGSTVSGSTASYDNGSDLASALKALKPLIHELTESQRATAEAALNALVSSAEGGPETSEQVGQAVEAVTKASPKLGERLKDIGGKIGASLASSAIFQAFKSYYGIH